MSQCEDRSGQLGVGLTGPDRFLFLLEHPFMQLHCLHYLKLSTFALMSINSV